MGEYENFLLARASAIRDLGSDVGLKKLGVRFVRDTAKFNYSYNFDWMGRPIIQVPQDIMAMQELIWRVKPDLIIETGIAHGGSLAMSASMLALLDYSDAVSGNTIVDPSKSKRKVLGIDIDIREHNRLAIEQHPMSHLIQMIQGSSIEPEIVQEVQKVAKDYQQILVCLDSNHTHDHVIAELQAYAPLASLGSYCVVFDTIIEDLPATMFPDRPWSIGNNPKTAVKEYLTSHPEFEIDEDIQNKLLISVAPNGYLKRVAMS
jgi:cephalosporin hydroxylase